MAATSAGADRNMTGTSTSDALLFERWREGDKQALEDLLRVELPRLRDRIKREQRSQLGASLGATDVAQEVGARMIARQNELEFKAREPMRAYLWRSAVNFVLDRLRRRRKRSDMPDPSEVAEARMMTARTVNRLEEDHGELFNAVQRLSFNDRAIVELVYLHGRSIKDAGRELGIAPDAARMRLNRALAKLRILIGDVPPQ